MQNFFVTATSIVLLATLVTSQGGPPPGIAASYASQYGHCSTYGPNNHPTGPWTGAAATPTTGVNTTSAGVPTTGAPLSSWVANSQWTTYGPSNHPTAAPSGVPASVSSYLANGAWPAGNGNGYGHGPWGAGGRGGGYGPYQSGAWVSGPYTNWWQTASGSSGACPPASWPGWTTGTWATNAAWTSWAGCTASSTATSVMTTTNTAGATVTETLLGYAGLAAANPTSAAVSQIVATVSSDSSASGSSRLHVGLGSYAVGLLFLAVAVL